MTDIPTGTCFVEHGAAVYLVTNWEHRRTASEPAVLIRLSPRHTAVFRTLAKKRRSQKSIYLALFVKSSARRRTRSTVVPIDLQELTPGQLVRLAHSKLRYPVPSLAKLPPDELRNLIRSLYNLAS